MPEKPEANWASYNNFRSGDLSAADGVLGVDIDDNALIAAGDNAINNKVALALRHSKEPLDERFDIVIANILTNPLCVLAPLLAGRVATGGRIALAGVLAPQAAQVIAAYAPWLDQRVAKRKGAAWRGLNSITVSRSVAAS